MEERDRATVLVVGADASDARRRYMQLFWNHMPQAVLPTDDPRTPIRAKYLRRRAGEGTKVRPESEVIAAYAFEKLGLSPVYESPLNARSTDKRDFRLG